jgi:PHS family inorganic phosphate transporter-like MFS transporter
MIIIIATLAQALSGHGPAVSIIGVLVFWRYARLVLSLPRSRLDSPKLTTALALYRFIMGVGVGGDYPLSAIITSEFAATRIRGRMMACVFSAQGYGQFLAALIGFISIMALKSDIINGPTTYDKVDLAWRILIGLGAVPGAIALYFRGAPDLDTLS